MDANEINAAIAESAGIVSSNQHGKLYHTEQGYVVDCPNYHGSLDAIVPVIRALNEDDFASVMEWLGYRVLATSAQWSEAYLRWKGLWK